MNVITYFPNSFFARNRFLFLFLSFILLFALGPFLERWFTISVLLNMLITAILMSAIYAISRNKTTLIAGIVLAVPFFLGRWAIYFIDLFSLKILGALSGVIFFGFISAVVVKNLFSETKITLDLVMASVCGYLILGLGWSFVYATIELAAPGSLYAAQWLGKDLSILTYFSFVTLTTVGYGDITPVSAAARNFAVLEAVIGQIYLTVLVARLVGMHISQSMQDER